MRIRYKSWATKYIEENPQLFINSYYNTAEMESKLNKYQKLEMEIGCGKGQFIAKKAIQNPDTLFIAIEKVPSIIVLATQKIIEQKIKNVLFFCGDVNKFQENKIFKNKIDKIYINFSDPWPKKRHAKRRLTAPYFLEIYSFCLKENGYLQQKTDNDSLFDYSIVNIGNSNHFNLEVVHINLHQTELENIQTEYEKKFSQKGFTIKYILAKKMEKDKK